MNIRTPEEMRQMNEDEKAEYSRQVAHKLILRLAVFVALKLALFYAIRLLGKKLAAKEETDAR